MSLGWKQFLLSRVLIAISVLMALFIGLIRRPFLLFRRTKRRTSPPDCMLDPTLGKHQYVQANGIKFHYVTCGDPSKPLMLFLHGFPEFWYSWRHQLKEFSADYHVVAVDLRGYNETERPPNVLDYTIANIRQDVVELIPALGHEKAILVGHDWGGGVAWNVAGYNPEVVEKLVVMNCPHPKIFIKRIQSFAQLLKSWYIFFFQVPYLPELMLSAGDYGALEMSFQEKQRGGVHNKKSFTAEDVEAYKYVFSQRGALTAPINYYRASFFGEESKGSVADKISMPTLLIWGENDAYFDLSAVEGHDSVVTDLTVRRIQDCSHWVQNDNPERVNQHMREFLENTD